jgi:hypothetical protein
MRQVCRITRKRPNQINDLGASWPVITTNLQSHRAHACAEELKGDAMSDTKDLIQRLRFGSIDDDLLAAAKEAADALEALSKDAERLNWIERQDLGTLIMGSATTGPHTLCYVHGDHGGASYGPHLRAAIDAAIAKEAK